MTKSELIAGIELTAALSAGYADSLRGKRTRGSVTKLGLDSLPETYTVSESYPHLAAVGTKILCGRDGGLGGRVGAVPMRDIDLEKSFLIDVMLRARVGEHGPELYLDRGEDGAKLPSSGMLTFIVATEGNTDGLQPGALITWFPGTPSALPSDAVIAAIEARIKRPAGPLSDIPADAMVKLHNG